MKCRLLLILAIPAYSAQTDVDAAQIAGIVQGRMPGSSTQRGAMGILDDLLMSSKFDRGHVACSVLASLCLFKLNGLCLTFASVYQSVLRLVIVHDKTEPSQTTHAADWTSRSETAAVIKVGTLLVLTMHRRLHTVACVICKVNIVYEVYRIPGYAA